MTKRVLRAILVMINVSLISFLPCYFCNAQTEDYSYTLTQTNANYSVWTTTPTNRIFKTQGTPSKTGSDVKVYCAKNETEPFVVVVKPATSGTISVSLNSFGYGITTEIFQVKYINISTATDNMGLTGYYPDPLWPLEDGATIPVTANENTAFWVNVYVPSNVQGADYNSNFVVAGLTIPIKLHVFDFTVLPELHVNSQMNIDYTSILNKYSVPGIDVDYWNYVDKIKLFFIRHRLTPQYPLWPGGLTSGGGTCLIDYDCNGTLSDPYGIWGFETPADKYLKGTGFNNGTGFPVFQAITISNNEASADQRPSSFCGLTRSASDWYTGNNPASSYNQKWFTYVNSIRNYLNSKSLLDKAYYLIANEPQLQNDYDAVAWYSQELKKVAPDLKLMISEEPKPEIYSHSVYTGSKIDIWLSTLNNYNPTISWEREKNNGENTWLYFFSSLPYFNPIILDHPGIEGKFMGWFFWKYRIKGLAHYSLNGWSQNPWLDPTGSYNGEMSMLYPPSENNTNIVYGSNNHRFVPSIRLELMRDGLEDFEYLFLLNGGTMPDVNGSNASDIQVDKVIKGLTYYTRDDEYLYNLRRLIGLKLGGEIESIPDIYPNPVHARSQGVPGNYYINFQDPLSNPVTDPLVVNGKTYLKIGWSQYNETDGFGWYGDLTHVMYQYLSSGPNELQKSVLYDDWAKLKTFEFDLPNGTYTVTVSAGSYGQGYPHQKIKIEGVDFINDEATTVADPYLVRSKNVTVSDYKLSLEMGIENEYTMLNYMDIESIATLVNSLEKSISVGIYPNPLTNISILKCDTNQNNLVEIFDLSGKVIYRMYLKNGQTELLRQNFNTGIYLVRVYDKDLKHFHVIKLLVGS